MVTRECQGVSVPALGTLGGASVIIIDGTEGVTQPISVQLLLFRVVKLLPLVLS